MFKTITFSAVHCLAIVPILMLFLTSIQSLYKPPSLVPNSGAANVFVGGVVVLATLWFFAILIAAGWIGSLLLNMALAAFLNRGSQASQKIKYRRLFLGSFMAIIADVLVTILFLTLLPEPPKLATITLLPYDVLLAIVILCIAYCSFWLVLEPHGNQPGKDIIKLTKIGTH